MGLPQEQHAPGERQVVVTSDIEPGTIFEIVPGGSPALFRGLSKVEATADEPKRIAASVGFVVELDCPSAALAVGDVVDYDAATKGTAAATFGTFRLGKVLIAKPAGQTRVVVDTRE